MSHGSTVLALPQPDGGGDQGAGGGGGGRGEGKGAGTTHSQDLAPAWLVRLAKQGRRR